MKANPFFLEDQDIKWVEETYESMTQEEKFGHLFLHFGIDDKKLLVEKILPKNIAGMLFRPRKAEEVRELHDFLQTNSKIPLLLAANIEDGGCGITPEGTYFGKQMQIAATGNKENAYRNGKISCGEAAALGVNWAFGPVSDIDMNFRNPITNVKTYGSNPDTVLENSLEFIRAAKECNVAVAAKHFPGEGPDEMDQHLVTVVNSLSCEEWDKTLGKVFKGVIDAGALTFMIGHIALPSYQRKFNPKFPERVIPATLSKELMTDLLRGQLEFNGLIVSDTTTIGGFTSAMAREKAIPLAIASGCDILMYSKDFDEDLGYIRKGYTEGVITEERLKEAVIRTLALKAALKLHIKQKNHTLVPPVEAMSVINCSMHQKWTRECADKAVTLVKDTQGLLPITPEKHHRVLFQLLDDSPNGERIRNKVMEKLTKKGFEVIYYTPKNPTINMENVADFKSHFDLAIYVGNIETRPDQTVSRIQWYSTKGATNLPWFVHEVPTMYISLANPYNLFDVPMIKTYINCYSNHNDMIDAVIEKITGNSQFEGISPVDPFCGRWDTSL